MIVCYRHNLTADVDYGQTCPKCEGDQADYEAEAHYAEMDAVAAAPRVATVRCPDCSNLHEDCTCPF